MPAGKCGKIWFRRQRRWKADSNQLQKQEFLQRQMWQTTNSCYVDSGGTGHIINIISELGALHDHAPLREPLRYPKAEAGYIRAFPPLFSGPGNTVATEEKDNSWKLSCQLVRPSKRSLISTMNTIPIRRNSSS